MKDKPMGRTRILVLIVCIFVALLAPFVGCIHRDRATHDAPDWRYDYETALANASALNRTVMIDLYTSWCHWCDTLDAETYSDGRVIARSTQFVCLKIDGDERSDLVERYDIRGYPTILFCDADGRELDRIVGYVEPDTLLEHMDRVLERT